MDYGWGEKRKKEKETETGERHACILKQGRYRIRRFRPTLTDVTDRSGDGTRCGTTKAV